MSAPDLQAAFLAVTDALAAKPWLYALQEGRWYTYGDARQGAARAAGVLAAHGVEEGGVFAVLLPNTVDALFFILAALWGRRMVAVLNPLLHPREVAHLLAHSESRVLVTSEALCSHLEVPCPIFRVDRDPLPDAVDATPSGPEDPFCLLYTSGTMGDPKGVVLTPGAVAANIAAISEFYQLDEHLCMLAVLPVSSVLGLVVTVGLPLFLGGETVFGPVFSPYDAPGFWRGLCERQVTHFCAVPSMLRILSHCSEPDPALGRSSFRHAFTSSAPFFPEEQQAFEDTFACPVAQCYGLTETAGWTTFGAPRPPRGLGSVGRPFGCEIRLVDETGRPGEAGEVRIRGPRLMKEYYRNPRATADVLRDGWLHTGDLGRWTSDGELVLVGRSKLMIARGGLKVHPREVDEALGVHPDVLESATVGVEVPLRGEEIWTYVVLRRAGATAADLRAHLRERIASYKVPDRVVVVDALPRGSGGKVSVQDLRAGQP